MKETLPDDGKKYYTDQEDGWCAWCGEALPIYRHWRTTFCNKQCNNAYFNSLTADARAEKRASLVCVTCGEPIRNTKRSHTKYCSHECAAVGRRRPDGVRARRSPNYWRSTFQCHEVSNERP